MMKSIECMPSPEENYDFIKIVLKLNELKQQMLELGIMNLIPVGSAVTKTLRKDNLQIDIILNYNMATLK